MPQTIQVARRRKWFPTWILLALAMTHSTNLYWRLLSAQLCSGLRRYSSNETGPALTMPTF